MRMGRLTSGGPLLCDHDTRDQIGVIESVQIGADRVARAVVRFGKSARAEEVFRDVVDGIRKSHQATATVFVKEGDEFVRVSTNVLTPEGKRGVGTQLARNAAYAAVHAKRTRG